MKIVDNKVEYNDREQETVERLAYLLGTMKMKPVALAYREALAAHGARPSKQFVEHLSKDTLTMLDGEVVRKEKEPEPVDTSV
jgi:hypothetical protein